MRTVLPERAVEVEDILASQRRLLAALMRSSALSRGDFSSALSELTEVAAVPEPATVALVATGLLTVAGVGARRRRRSV